MYVDINFWVSVPPLMSSKMLLAPLTTGAVFCLKHRIHGEFILVVKNVGQIL